MPESTPVPGQLRADQLDLQWNDDTLTARRPSWMNDAEWQELRTSMQLWGEAFAEAYRATGKLRTALDTADAAIRNARGRRW